MLRILFLLVQVFNKQSIFFFFFILYLIF